MINKIQDQIIQQKKNLLINKPQQNKKITIQKGEIVNAKVLKSESGGLARLLIRGEELTARTSIHLKKGMTASFKVEETHPQPLLKYIESDSESLNKSQLLATKSSPYKMLAEIFSNNKANLQNIQQMSGNNSQLVKLWDLFNNLSIKPNDNFSPSLLMSFIYKSGLLWESKLKSLIHSGKNLKSKHSIIDKDIKGLTLDILRNNPGLDKELKSYLSSILDNIEQLQLINKTSLEENGRALLLLPMQFNNEFDFGQLFFDISGKRKAQKKNENGPLIVTLLLKMTNLGPVRVDAFLFIKTVKVNIYVCNDNVESLINQSSELLKKQLQRHGFDLQQVNCYVTEKEEIKETSLIDELLKKEHNFSLFA